MLSIYDIADWINDLICGTFKGAKTYGVATSVYKDGEILPVDGETYIGLDDTYPMIAYHKHDSISSSSVARSGYGDVEAYLQNSYGMSLVLFFDERKCGLNADNIYILIQSQITGVLKHTEGVKTVRVSVNNAIINDGQVWSQEYGQAQFRLNAYQRLIKIGYSVVFTLDKKCIPIPHCKN